MSSKTSFGCLLCGTPIDDPPSQCGTCGAVNPAGVTGDTTLNELVSRIESSDKDAAMFYLQPLDEDYFLVMVSADAGWRPGFLISRNGSPVTPEIVDEVAARAGFTVVETDLP